MIQRHKTVVSTKVPIARAAIVYAGILNIVGAFIGTHVASMVGKGIKGNFPV